MIKLVKRLSFLSVWFVLLLSPDASASAAHLSFGGAFDRILYSTCVTQFDNGDCSEFGSTAEVDATDLYQGIVLSLGDAFDGAFSYRQDDGFVLSDNGFTVDYRSVISNAIFSSGLLGLPNSDLEVAFWDLGNFIAVTNDSPSGDRVTFLQNFYSENWRGLFTLSFSDSTGEVFSDTHIPTAFALENFSLVTFRLNIEHTGGSGDRVDIFGDINSLTVTPIPIPSALLLLFSACGGMTFFASMKPVRRPR